MGEIEHGKCEVCGKESDLQQTYFRYDIKCGCHSPNHFEFIRHCKDCVPKEPQYTQVRFKTEELKNPVSIAMGTLIKALKKDKTEGSYYYAWQSNIACSIMDNSDIDHGKANKIAVNFLESLIR